MILMGEKEMMGRNTTTETREQKNLSKGNLVSPRRSPGQKENIRPPRLFSRCMNRSSSDGNGFGTSSCNGSREAEGTYK